MASIFVSYKAEDRRRVRPIVESLEAQGFSVWWDARIGGGDSWRAAIQKELEAADCVVVVWSKRSVGSEGRFVCDEASRAVRRGVYLPVLIDRVEPPLGFGESQAVSLVGWKGDQRDPRVAALVDAAQAIATGQARATFSSTPTDSGFSRRTAIVGAGVVTLAAGAGGWILLRPSRARADSIAVLPFENLSGDPGQAYFSEGIAEELRSALSRIPKLKVVARASSEAVRNDDVKTAASKLGVSNVLTGSVRRSPATIRISTQLIDGGTGLERWSQTFDRPFGDTLALQTNIAETVAEALSIQLSSDEKAALALGGTANIQAYDLLLKANPVNAAEDSPERLQRGIATLDAALALDPNYAEAYVRKAFALTFYALVYAHGADEAHRLVAEAAAAAQRAIAIAPRFQRGHAALARAFNFQLRFKEGLAEIRRAMQLPGKDELTLGYYAVVLSEFGWSAQGLNAAQEAIAIDPLSPGPYEWKVSVLYHQRQFERAMEVARHALAMAPARTFSRGVIAKCLLMMGRYSEAQATLADLPQDDLETLASRAGLAAALGDRGKSDSLLAQMSDSFGEAARFRRAQVYAFRKQADLATDELGKALAARLPILVTIKVEPMFDAIRNDPRLSDIIRRLDFPS